jgi:8-oxo-dGTP pyrophosphatase MutT (NUDIX family)
MSLGDGSREPVEAAIERLRERHEDLTVDRATVENDPDYFAHGEALAEDGHLAGAGAWVEHEDRVLFIRHPDAPDSWGLPGGGVEPGETLAETARREVREETGVEVRVTDAWKARHRAIVHRDDPDRLLHMLDVWFDAVAEDPEIPLDPAAWEEDEEILEARWFSEPPEAVHERFETRVAAWNE